MVFTPGAKQRITIFYLRKTVKKKTRNWFVQLGLLVTFKSV